MPGLQGVINQYCIFKVKQATVRFGYSICSNMNSIVHNLQTINATMAAAAGPAVVCGDFNTAPSGEVCELILQHWQDAAVVNGNPRNTFSFDKPHVRIDYAFLSSNARWKVTDVQVLPYHYSDHMPVLFTIELE